MEARNCPKCGKVFYYNGKSVVCDSCTKEEEILFQKVRDYLKENPGSKLNDVVKETGVSAKRINKYLREGRLEVTTGLGDILRCMKCDKPIRTGKYCETCAEKLGQKLSGLYQSPGNSETKSSKDATAKMRHLNQK